MNPLSLVRHARWGGWTASTQVTLLAAGVLVPALLLAVLVAQQLVSSTRDQAVQTTLQVAREVAAGVDRQLLTVKQMLKIFANSYSLKVGDLEAFRRELYEVTEQTGLPMSLRDPYNKQIINTAIPHGTAPPTSLSALDGIVRRMVSERQTVVTDLVFGELRRRHVVFVLVPVVKDDAVAYVLSAVIPATLLRTAADRIPTGNGFRGGIIDGAGKIVMRNPRHEDYVGGAASEDILKNAIGDHGTWTGANVEGVQTLGAYVRLKEADWLATVGVSRSSFTEPLFDILTYIALAGLGLLVGGLVVAYLIGRHISFAFQILGKAGDALLRKEVVQPASTRVWEADQAAQVLSEASHDMRRAEEQIRFAAEAAGVGTWGWDAASNLVTASDLGATILGLAGAGAYPPEAIMDCIVPADRQVQQDAFRACLRGKAVLETELRVIDSRRDAPRWVRAIGRVDFGSNGRAVRMQGIVQDISAEKHAQEIRLELLRKLMTAEERERLRLSRELHDHTGQSITAALLEIKALEAVIPVGAHARLRRLRGDLEDMGRDLHRLAIELRATSLVDVGLEKVLANYVADWSVRTGIRADFHAGTGDLREVPEAITTTVYRVVQETLTNIVKHARGTTAVSVLLDRDEHQLRLTIEDNGCGFDVAASGTTDAVVLSGRLGLAGIRERLMLISGDMEIESSPDVGTTIFVRIELKRERISA